MKTKNILTLIISIASITFNPMYASINRQTKTADLIIFSFNRPMQLYALLESIDRYVTNLNQIYIVYRASDREYDNGYKEIKRLFPQINYLKQGSNPRNDFKPLLLQGFFGSSAEYIMFAVDDDIVKDYIDINQCVDALEKTNAYGFYLRMGANITIQYNQGPHTIIPPFTSVDSDIVKFNFNLGWGDWNYPHNIDMTIFRKSNIQEFMRHNNYSTPNTLEASLASVANVNVEALCYIMSKKFMVPLNIVQQDWWTPNQNSYSVASLLDKWNQGLKIDLNEYFQLNNNCPFVDQKPTFIPRSSIKR